MSQVEKLPDGRYILDRKDAVDKGKEIVLIFNPNDRRTPFATHFRDKASPGDLYLGNYFDWVMDALKDFQRRN